MGACRERGRSGFVLLWVCEACEGVSYGGVVCCVSAST